MISSHHANLIKWINHYILTTYFNDLQIYQESSIFQRKNSSQFSIYKRNPKKKFLTHQTHVSTMHWFHLSHVPFGTTINHTDKIPAKIGTRRSRSFQIEIDHLINISWEIVLLSWNFFMSFFGSYFLGVLNRNFYEWIFNFFYELL